LDKKTLPTFAMNPTIIFAHWVICRLSYSQICSGVATGVRAAPGGIC